MVQKATPPSAGLRAFTFTVFVLLSSSCSFSDPHQGSANTQISFSPEALQRLSFAMGAQSSALTAAVNTPGTAGSAYCFAIYASDTGFDPCRLPEGDSSPVLFLSARPTSTLLASKAIELAVRPGPHKIFQLLGMAPSGSSSSNPQCPGAEFEGFHRFLQLIAGNKTIKSQLLNQTLVEYGRAVTDIPKGAASVNVDLTINSTATAARTMPFFCQNGASPAGGVVLQNGNGTGTEFVSTESDSSLAQDFVLPFEAAPKLKSD